MKFELTDEQVAFRDSIAGLLDAADTVSVARAWAAGDHQPGIDVWNKLAEQGVNALAVPEEADGLGASLVEVAVAHQVLGYYGAVGPWIEATAFLPHALDDATALGELASGQLATAAVPELMVFAPDADVAEVTYRVDGSHIASVPVTEVGTSVDTTRRLGVVDLGAPAATKFATAIDAAVLATAAHLLGAGERLLADTVAYAKQRRQFGREIGSYQAIKHQLADVRIALDFVGPLVFGAALADIPASAAKVAAADAAYLAARVGLQVHGAIGYTRECDISIWIGRVQALISAWGTPDYHRHLLATQL